ncbi:MAG: GNAT family N-acetyltransferase [Coriobacteriales bacterium]|nr:GNAT family N-acetyltransferase [Coriobacteriales bacterium]
MVDVSPSLDYIEELLSKPYWVIDALPVQVPKERGKRFFAIEPWLIEGERGLELRSNFLKVVMGLSCYYNVVVYRGDGAEAVRNPAPAEIERWVLEDADMLNLLIEGEDALLSIPDGSTCMALYNPHPQLLVLVSQLAAANGLFVWQSEHVDQRPVIRKATIEDISRIAEIHVFVKRLKFWPIFKDDEYSFKDVQVLTEAQRYADPSVLSNLFVYDDGVVKGFMHIENSEIVNLYVDYFFQGQGIGGALIEYAKEHVPVSFLWALECNTDAIRFYEAHGFVRTDERELEDGTSEYLVKMRRV